MFVLHCNNFLVKKDTLKLQKYEENLVQYYKKFLQKLEKSTSILLKKKGDTRKFHEVNIICSLF